MCQFSDVNTNSLIFGDLQDKTKTLNSADRDMVSLGAAGTGKSSWLCSALIALCKSGETVLFQGHRTGSPKILSRLGHKPSFDTSLIMPETGVFLMCHRPELRNPFLTNNNMHGSLS